MNFNNPALEELFSSSVYELNEDTKKSLLLSSVLTELKFHYDNNQYYKRYCDKIGINFEKINEYGELPYIPAIAFKEMGAYLNSVGDGEITVELKSSATSGVPSTVKIDKITSRRQVKALSLVLGNRLGKERRPFFIIDVDPRHANPMSIGARGAAIKGFLNLASKAEYFMQAEDDNMLWFDKDKFIKNLTNTDSNQPVIIFGFTYVIYSELIEKFASENIRLEVPKGSMLVHIGGWKKLEHKKVDRTVFISQAVDVFGLGPENVVDFYGFTEQLGVTYPDCECGWKHTPNFSEIIIRREEDHSLLSRGQKGLIELITPIPHSYPGNAILTDDIGIVALDGETPCSANRTGTRFKLLGRAQKTEVRGCGDVMASKVIDSPRESSQNIAEEDNEIEVLYQFHGKNEKINLDEFRDRIKEVKKASGWLRKQKVDMLIGLIDRVATKWRDQEFELNEFQQQGLLFLASWCSADNLKKLAENALKKRAYLDQFLKIDDNSMKFIKAVPKGLAAHWLSGNVPVLGMLVLVQSIVSKNTNILKASHNYSSAIPALLKSFENEEYTSPGGETINGNDLLKTILAVYFSRKNKSAAELLSTEADIRIAWGGRDAVYSVANLPKKYMVDDIIFGPKLSFMVVGKELLKDDRKLKKLIRKASVDSSVFDQTACASPHTIFVEQGGDIAPKEFAARLAEEMEKTSIRIPPSEINTQTKTNIESKRISYNFIGDVWNSNDLRWTVLYDENLTLPAPTYGRVISVKGVDDVFDTIALIHEDIQTIGLELKGKRRFDYAAKAADRGAQRFPEVGLMTHFEDPWDGVFVLQKCVKWVSLGGPN